MKENDSMAYWSMVWLPDAWRDNIYFDGNMYFDFGCDFGHIDSPHVAYDVDFSRGVFIAGEHDGPDDNWCHVYWYDHNGNPHDQGYD
ncbi:MAG: hypothetical protein LBB45_02495 [Methanobrevibacter sp.]|nr:hypothetical protein [Candidatus Methanovirga basalitermitum]